MIKHDNEASFQKFLVIWIGEFISIIGSGMTGFALSIYIYKKTSSATLFSIVALVTILPSMLIRTISGSLADKFDRKSLMIIGDAGSLFGILFIAIMFRTGKLEFWHIFLGMGFSSFFSGLGAPSTQSLITQLTPKKNYAQASGMVQAISSGQYIISPILGGILIGLIDIKGILIFDVISFAFAIIMISLVKTPPLIKTVEQVKESLLKNIFLGYRYLKEKFPLLMLIILLSVMDFFLGFLIVLIGPMILASTTPKLYGIGQSISAIGMLVSSIVIGIIGVPKSHIKTTLWAMLIIGISIFTIGVQPNLFIIFGPCFLFFFTLPYLNSSIDVIIRKKVHHHLQGRVYAVIGIMSSLGLLLSYSVSGYLADKIFNPMFLKNGYLANTVGKIIGTGEGRGIGFMFVIAGFFILLLTVITYSFKGIRDIEKNMLDVVED